MKRTFVAASLLIGLWNMCGWAQTAPAEPKTNYAVVNLKCSEGVTAGEGELITDRLRSELFNTGKVNVMERNQMQEILKEQGFQQSGACTDEACLVEMGQMLGVKIMVVGSLGKLGSMFMVNIRAIDVQTAQIVKVVSVDIKGDIEEVVEHLKSISAQLTGSEAIAPPPPPQPVVKEEEQPAEVAAVEEKKVEPEEIVQRVDDSKDGRNEKNRNRGGVGLAFNLFGRVSHYIEGQEVEGVTLYDDYSSDYVYVDTISYTRTGTPQMDFLLRFYIRAGKYLNIEIGPHFYYGNETYTSIYTPATIYDMSPAELYLAYWSMGVHVGVDFVKRIYPLKINAGAFCNFTVPFVYYNYDGYNNDGSTFSDNDVNVSFKFVPGVRAGAEILAGTHVGFSLDFVFQWVSPTEMDFDFDEMDTDLFSTSSTMFTTQEIHFPLFGVGFGVNFYF